MIFNGKNGDGVRDSDTAEQTFSVYAISANGNLTQITSHQAIPGMANGQHICYLGYWVLRPNTLYCNANGRPIATTDAWGKFPGTAANPEALTARIRTDNNLQVESTWTGLTDYWGSSMCTCLDWSANSFSGIVGNSLSNQSPNFIRLPNTSLLCNTRHTLYCAQQ